jgi:Mg-chelatase subunit ChlD
MTKTNTTPVHISVLLDRSGSMSAIASDIVGGFNSFLDEQRKQPGDARLTLVQFDTGDPFEVVIDGRDLDRVLDMPAGAFIPRGGTPLLDAVARLIIRTDGEIAARADRGLPIEDQLVMIVTDGYENASVEQTRASVAAMIDDRRGRAWTFAFLGANQDAFDEADSIGMAQGSAANWDASEKGTAAMWNQLSTSTSTMRSKSSEERKSGRDEFFGPGSSSSES